MRIPETLVFHFYGTNNMPILNGLGVKMIFLCTLCIDGNVLWSLRTILKLRLLGEMSLLGGFVFVSLLAQSL